MAISALAYAWLGPYLPAPWTHRGYGLPRIVGHMYMTLEGIFGSALDVAATFILLFGIYGSALNYSKASEFFMNLSLALTRGKPTSVAGQNASVVPAWWSFRLGRRDHCDARLGRLAASGEGRLRACCRRRSARGGRHRRHTIAACTRCRGLPDFGIPAKSPTSK